MNEENSRRRFLRGTLASVIEVAAQTPPPSERKDGELKFEPFTIPCQD